MATEKPFLLEIVTEELPSSYIEPALEHLQGQLDKILSDKRVEHSELRSGATPRRLVVYAQALDEHSQKQTIEIKGPPVTVAYKDGEPTQALGKFMENNGLHQEDLFTQKLAKGEYIFGRKEEDFGPTREILAQELSAILVNLPFPKRMHWIQAQPSLLFARPIRNVLLLLGEKQIFFELNLQQNLVSQGRFYYRDQSKSIHSLSQYFAHLEQEGIILDIAERERVIQNSLNQYAAQIGARVDEDMDLLREVTHLVETPYVGQGEFSEHFLSVPQSALLSVMKSHQKYFALYNEQGELKSQFLFVANQPVTPSIISGNERVLRARFKDAQFFYDEDRSQKLEQLHPRLSEVIFTKESGHFLHKYQRILGIIDILLSLGVIQQAEQESLARTAYLAKCDLLTNLVYEFPELQGEVGYLLAQEQDEPKQIAQAIFDQYLPRFAGDSFPQDELGALYSIAEKADNLSVLFATGKRPTGSADPYALRRQAIGMVEILLYFRFDLDISLFFGQIFEYLQQQDYISEQDLNGAYADLMEFFKGRCRSVFGGRGYPYDSVEAVLSVERIVLTTAEEKIRIIESSRNQENFAKVAHGFKRIHNLLTSARKKDIKFAGELEKDLLTEPAEKELHQSLEQLSYKQKYEQKDKKDLAKQLELLLSMRQSIDSFFDSVMVMVEDKQIRNNRLRLLQRAEEFFFDFADFSRLSD